MGFEQNRFLGFEQNWLVGTWGCVELVCVRIPPFESHALACWLRCACKWVRGVRHNFR